MITIKRELSFLCNYISNTSVRSLTYKNPRYLSPDNQTRNSKQPGTRHVGL